MARSYINPHATSGLAVPLTLVYCGLVIYASLYPFAPWQSQGVMPWAFVTAALPRYWSVFDVVVNVLGYLPLGFLMALACAERWTWAQKHPVVSAALSACFLSFGMEALQTYLSPRVPSNMDWLLNTLGGALGGLMVWVADSLGLLRGWSRWRAGRFTAGSGTALGLLFLWPLALLYPTAIPLGLGYGAGQWLGLDGQILSDRQESVILALGLLIPTLLAYAITPRVLDRVGALILLLLAALCITTLSNGLSFGPEHATVWLHEQSLHGLWAGAALGLLLLVMPTHFCWVLAFLLLVPCLGLVNIMAPDPYLAQTLAHWEQGQFIRFYGATQWLGWLWPYATLALLITRITRHNKN